MKKTALLIVLLIGGCSTAFGRAMSILDIKHSVTDDNIVPPESFETKTRELEENFYLKNYTERAAADGAVLRLGTPEEYQQLLGKLPTEIEMPYNEVVGKYIDMYLGKKRELVADMVALHNYYGNIFVEELIKEKMPLELQYLPVIESALNPNAVSRAGAGGLWQFMPATASGLGLEVNSLVDQRRDPRLASRQAARYLKQLYEAYGDWSLAIAAYNCGPGNVNKAQRRAGGGKKDFWEIYHFLPQETRGYVPAFIAANFVMNYYDRYGIRPTLVKQQLVTDTVNIDKRVHFNQIAEVLNIPIEEIRMLNPQFRKDIIPGNNHPYSLVLPSQQCLSYIMSEDAILALDSDRYAMRSYVVPGESRDGENAVQSQDGTVGKRVTRLHKVKRGENLRDIAKQYGVSATDIKRWNNLRRGKVRAGQELVIKTIERDRQLAEPASKDLRADSTTTLADVRQSQTVDSAQRQVAPATSKTVADNRAKEKKAAQPKTQKQSKPARPTTYKVRSGDNLSKIAKRHGVTVAELQSANGMSKGDTRIDVGQVLKIPAHKSSSSNKTASKKRRKRR